LYRRILNLLALCVLAGVAAATWYWSRPGDDTSPALRSAGEQPPSYYLKDATLLETNEDGRVLYQIRAKLVEERPDDGALVADEIELEWRETEAVPWVVKAGRAVVSVERRLLEREHGVELVREPRDDGDVAVVRTERLVLEPERHVARADGDVRLEVGASTLTAVGLVAFLQEDRLELERNVRGAVRP